MQDFKQSAALFVSLRSPYLEPATVRSHKLALNSFQDAIGNRDIHSYTSIDILTFVQAQVHAKRKPNGINVYLRVLKAFGSWLTSQKILPHDNPFSELDLLKVRKSDIRFLTNEEFSAIYQNEPNLLLRQVYLAALTTAQRLSDVVSLKWEQIDLASGLIRFIARKTNGRNSIPIHRMLNEVLDQIGIRAQGPVFQSRLKKHLTPSYVSHRFLAAAKRARVDGVTFHALRRTFASWLDLLRMPGHSILLEIRQWHIHGLFRFHAGSRAYWNAERRLHRSGAAS